MVDLSNYKLIRGVDVTDEHGGVTIEQHDPDNPDFDAGASVVPADADTEPLWTEPFDGDGPSLVNEVERERAIAALEDAQ